MNPKSKSFIRHGFTVAQVLLLLPIGWFFHHLFMPRIFTGAPVETLSFGLSGGKFSARYYPAENPKGILIVATGDGGWSGQWEEPLALHAAASGFAVGGWDCRKFSDSRSFDHAQLVEAFNVTVEAVRKRAGLPIDTPVWYTGWSTGAEWALNAAASPEREENLVGVVLVSPGSRSRYGINANDLLGLNPEGPDTYALADLAPALHGIRVVQFSGELDPLDDTDWLDALNTKTPHKLITIPKATHDMNGAGPRFLSEFDMAIQWTLDTPAPAEPSPHTTCSGPPDIAPRPTPGI